jgi:hypothetical protein
MADELGDFFLGFCVEFHVNRRKDRQSAGIFLSGRKHPTRISITAGKVGSGSIDVFAGVSNSQNEDV